MLTAFALAAVMMAPATEVRGTVSGGRGALSNAVVSLEGGSEKPKPLKGIVIDQKGKEFIPHVTAVTPGTAIVFPNHDTVYHNVFAHFDAARFDLGVYPRGAVKTKTFNKAGVVSLMCSIHSEMNAYIVIVDTPYFAVTRSDGSFSIPGVAAGTYTLNVWHESGVSHTQSLTVGSNVAPLALKAVRR